MTISPPRKKIPKSGPDFPESAFASTTPQAPVDKAWAAIGFDLSPSSIAGAACAFKHDERGTARWCPVFTELRWPKHTHYFTRLTDCAHASTLVRGLISQMAQPPVEQAKDVYIAVEEPFPLGMVKRMESSALKQQAEISGAFLGGLLKGGFENIFQIGNHQWRMLVAEDLGISIHYNSWNYENNPFPFAPSGRGSGKWRSKEWALKTGHYQTWPDLILSHKHGKIPRPEGSRARAVQPDDRFDALAIMEWMRRELSKGP